VSSREAFWLCLKISSGHRRRRRGQGATASPRLGSYSGKSETNPGKFENIQANIKNIFLTCNDAQNDHAIHRHFWKSAIKVSEILFFSFRDHTIYSKKFREKIVKTFF